MKRADDIYHEDNLPSLARRNMSRHHRKKREVPFSRSISSKHEHKRHHRSGGEHRGTSYTRKLIVAVLCVIALVYVAFLINSFRSPGEKKAIPKNSAGDTVTQASSVDKHGPDLERLQQLIKNSSQVNEDLVRVYSLLNAGHVDAAYRKIQQAVRNRPDDLSVKKALAAIYSGQENYAKAASILVDVLQNTSGDVEARKALINVLAALKNYQGVVVISNWVLDDEPYATGVHYSAALACLELDDVPQAIIHLKRVLEIDNQNRSARNLLGVAYRRQGAYDKAINLFTEQLAVDDADSSIYYNLAVCYAERHQAGKSAEYLSQAIDLFGASFVEAWLQSDHFNGVRNDASFVALNNRISSKTGSLTQ